LTFSRTVAQEGEYCLRRAVLYPAELRVRGGEVRWSRRLSCPSFSAAMILT